MSLHRICCGCSTSACPTSWNICATPTKVSLSTANLQRQAIMCDPGQQSDIPGWGCTCPSGGYQDLLVLDRSIDFALTDVLFAYDAGTDTWQVVAYASNTGLLSISWSDTGDGLPYAPTVSGGTGSCSGSFVPSTALAFSSNFNNLPVDSAMNMWQGSIRAEQVDGVCKFLLDLEFELVLYDILGVFSLVRTSFDAGLGNATYGEANIDRTLTVHCTVRASAPYDPAKCPKDATWTLDSVDIDYATADYTETFNHPESTLATLCPIGTGTNCSLAGVGDPCFLVEGFENVVGSLFLLEYPGIGSQPLDSSGFQLVSMDTPNLSVTA